MSQIINKKETKIKFTTNFIVWLKSESLENQQAFSIKDLFEIYINQICWNEIEKDPELEASDLILRM